MKRKSIITLVRILFLVLFTLTIISGKMILWLVLFGVSLPLALIWGRLYCGYACPMNTVMIVSDKIAKKMGGNATRRDVPRWLSSRFLPWVLLAISIITLLLGRRVLKTNIPLLPAFVFLSFIITLFYKPEVFHNYICPFGAMQNVFGRFALRSQTVNAASCIGCKKCEEVCPSLAVKVSSDTRRASIYPGDCLQCQNCTQVCPTKAIAFGRPAGNTKILRDNKQTDQL